PAGSAVETDQLPLLDAEVVRGGSFAVQARLERCAGAAADSGRDENLVLPNDQTRMRQAGDWRLPENVGSMRSVPTDRQALPVRNAGGPRSAERGPVLRGRRECQEDR